MNRALYGLQKNEYETLDLMLRRMSASHDGRILHVDGSFEDEMRARGFKLFNIQGAVSRLYWEVSRGETMEPAAIYLDGSDFQVSEATGLIEQVLKRKVN